MSAFDILPGLLAVLALAGTAAAANSGSNQLSPSVLLMGQFDWQLYTGSDGKPWTRCLDMVWRARRWSTGNRLNFVITHHWLPGSDGFGVSQFCYMPSSGSCNPWTPDMLAQFTKSMQSCFAEAFRQGFIPYVRPHLDDGLKRGVWRNGLLFDPTVKYGSYSYHDIMTTPLAQAMKGALATVAQEGKLFTAPDKSRPVVYMGLQGEMSATIMRYTAQWATLIPDIKATIGSTYADVKVGVGLNFNALDAIETHGSSTSGLAGLLMGSGSRAPRYPVPSIDGAAVKDLLSTKVDFLGISAYAPYSGAGFGLGEFQNSAFSVGDALRSLANGIDLAGLSTSGKLELHFSEFGIGGGQDGNAVFAASADGCAKQPWAGISGSYSISRDPWQRSDLSSFRSSFYNKATQWLSQPNSFTYNIHEVFVWGMASWDLFGIYPDSTSSEGTFRDANTVKQIARYNAAVISAQCGSAVTKVCSTFIKNNAACLSASGAGCLDPKSGSSSIVTESGPKSGRRLL